MPTIILLDVSLSMCRTLPLSDTNEPYQIKNLANYGINSFLDYLSQHCKLEYASLMIFSSYWEIVTRFTRDYDSIRSALNNVDSYDQTKFMNALRGVQNMVVEEWGTSMPIQVIIVTDGNAPINGTLLNNPSYSDHDDFNISKWPFPAPFPCKLHIVCLSPINDVALQTSLPFFNKLIELNHKSQNDSSCSEIINTNHFGNLWIPEGAQLSLKSVNQLFNKLAETNYRPFRGTLHCGMLKSPIALYPAPENYIQTNDFEMIRAEIANDIQICGFMDINEVASPPVHSRHLVLPLPASREEVKKYASVLVTNPNGGSESNVDVEELVNSLCSDEGRQPSFCVLLHGSLKVEGMVAICQIGNPNWYGMLYSWADNKKKSNLMLSAFKCGSEAVSWLGNLKLLGLSCLSIPQTITDVSSKRSFSQNCVVWLKQSNLQYDVQKILRHARKLPEKSSNFYKELNRLRRAALSFGFYDLLNGLATILERECTMLPGTAHPDAALQLTHAVNCLKAPRDTKTYDNNITPLETKFNTTN